MVKPDHIISCKGSFNTVYPPPVSLFFQQFPVVNRIAPILPVGGEIIRRNASDRDEVAVCIRIE
jgi:hypothetical protein